MFNLDDENTENFQIWLEDVVSLLPPKMSMPEYRRLFARKLKEEEEIALVEESRREKELRKSLEAQELTQEPPEHAA